RGDAPLARFLRLPALAQSPAAVQWLRAPRGRRAHHTPVRRLLSANPQPGEPGRPRARVPRPARPGRTQGSTQEGGHTMEMTGEQQIPVSQERTWRALNDLDVLKACIPGCESIVASGEDEYDVVLTAKVGPVSARFKGKLKLSDINPPQSYNLAFE